MGSSTIYLLPDLTMIAPAEYASRARSLLTEMGIICDERLPEDPSFYSPGENSIAPFENGVGWECGFQMCVICGGPQVRLIPTDPAVNPHCPQCSADVSDEYYDAINSGGEVEPPVPDDEIRVVCPQCGGSFRCDELIDEVGIFLVNAYLNFDDVPGTMHPRWLSGFEACLGVKHRYLEYWYT